MNKHRECIHILAPENLFFFESSLLSISQLQSAQDSQQCVPLAGSNLFHLARNKFPESKDEALRKSLENALRALTLYGVQYEDEKLDNFMWVDEK